MKHKLYSGLKIGQVTLVRRVEGEKGRGPRWICRCDCGEEVEKSRDVLTNPLVVHRCKSCYVRSQRAYSNLRIAAGLPANQWSKNMSEEWPTDRDRPSTREALQSLTEKDWELIGLRATVAQQAQMIEHLRGGLGNEPRLVSYAEDMSTCTLTNGDGIGYCYDRVDPDQPAGYTAVDMATAAAQGFRDGRKSVGLLTSKAFITLDCIGGQYSINMKFQNADDAYAAHTEIATIDRLAGEE